MKIHPDITVFRSQGQTFAECEIEHTDDDLGLTFYADVRGFRAGPGLWEHYSTYITGIDVLRGNWKCEIRDTCTACAPKWNAEIAEAMEAAWLDDREMRDEAAAERRVG